MRSLNSNQHLLITSAPLKPIVLRSMRLATWMGKTLMKEVSFLIFPALKDIREILVLAKIKILWLFQIHRHSKTLTQLNWGKIKMKSWMEDWKMMSWIQKFKSLMWEMKFVLLWATLWKTTPTNKWTTNHSKIISKAWVLTWISPLILYKVRPLSLWQIKIGTLYLSSKIWGWCFPLSLLTWKLSRRVTLTLKLSLR